MKAIIFLSFVFGIMSLNGCKDKDPKITKTLELSEEMKAYFVNYEVGTKWIYQDTVNSNVYDTIELLSKERFDVDKGNGTLQKGFELFYKPKKSKEFILRVGAGNNNLCNAKLDPMVTAAGAVVFENYDGVWTKTLTTFYDSLQIGREVYNDVIQSHTHNQYQYEVAIARGTGIVFFHSNYFERSWGASLKLIKVIKP